MVIGASWLTPWDIFKVFLLCQGMDWVLLFICQANVKLVGLLTLVPPYLYIYIACLHSNPSLPPVSVLPSQQAQLSAVAESKEKVDPKPCCQEGADVTLSPLCLTSFVSPSVEGNQEWPSSPGR